MNKVLEWVGGVLLLLGVCGVIRELTGWLPFMGATRFLTENVEYLGDRAVFTNAVIAVLGFALVAAGRPAVSRGRRVAYAL
ncbi:hypothetical protein ABT354_09710 [Streptomyces sp. NPDC000594]|uniref:hypothetical protein n=1 Tax=Streptomyces sp. NPDC000594 TaxID=3154261 RepID=UPI00331F2E97